MRSFTLGAAITALAAVASARKCQNLTIPISISARNAVFSIPAPVTNIDVTNFILDLTQQGMNYTQQVLTGYTTISKSYNIEATYCEPDCGASSTVQLLTHGIGFDRSYWDFSANNYNYSYVAEAVDQYGYSTFAWDRLGIGMSSHGDPVNEIQSQLEVQALHALTTMLRAGTISGVPKASKIVHIGHSYGSEHTYALTAQYPNDSDGIVLTGFSQNGSFVPYFALGSNFIQANQISALSAYANGYLAPGLQTGVQIDFFSPGMFSPAILAAAYATGQPVTVGELLTIGGETGSINHFAGPCLIITGGRDIPYCGGNCLGTGGAGGSIPAMAKATLPNVQDFQAVIVPNAGHGLNLEYSHPYTYGTILNYLVQNGLGPVGCAAGASAAASTAKASSTAAATSTSKASSAAASTTKAASVSAAAASASPYASSTGWGQW